MWVEVSKVCVACHLFSDELKSREQLGNWEVMASGCPFEGGKVKCHVPGAETYCGEAGPLKVYPGPCPLVDPAVLSLCFPFGNEVK